MKRFFAVLIAAMLVLTCFAGCSAEENSAPSENPVVLKIGNSEFTLADVNYMYVSTFMDMYNYYYSLYSSYGIDITAILDVTKPLEEQMIDETTSWHQYVLDYTVDNLVTVVGIYEEAQEKGFVLPEDYQTDIDTLEEQLEGFAAESEMTVEEYLTANYGEGTTVEAVSKMTELQLVCNAYIMDYQNNVSVSDEDIEAYYNANKNTIDTVDFRFFTTYYSAEGEEGALTLEEAENRANALAACSGIDEFNALAYEYGDESQKAAQDAGSDITLYPEASYDSTGIEEVSEWLFDEARTAGETYVYHDEDYACFITLMFCERNDPDYNFVNVRHILLVPPAEEDATPSEQAWAEAESRANEVLDKYLSGEQTEEAFAELAIEYSADGNAAQGGIYENVYKGQMVTAFEDWCFDETRAVGDTGIVKTPYGYHVMYFSGFGENNLVSLIQPNIAQERVNAWMDECCHGLSAERLEGIENVGGMVDEIANASLGVTEEPETEEKKEGFSTDTVIVILVAVIIVCVGIIIKNAAASKKKAAEEVSEKTEEVCEEELSEESAEETAEEENTEESSEE